MKAGSAKGLDGQAMVRRVLTHFNQEAFHYSLESPLLGRHSVDEFLFDTRMGYCEHYASAFTVMMRMAGIPSRIVTGYQGGWYNEVGNYLLVRQSDAHAWSEVWFPDLGWDPCRPDRGRFTLTDCKRFPGRAFRPPGIYSTMPGYAASETAPISSNNAGMTGSLNSAQTARPGCFRRSGWND